MTRPIIGVVITVAALALSAIVAAGVVTARDGDDPTLSTTASSQTIADGDSQSRSGNTYFPRQSTLSQEDGDGKPFVGVAIGDLPPAEAEELGVAGGAIVRRVLEDGPSAGVLLGGDIIVALNGQNVTGAADLVDMVRLLDPGDIVKFTVVRGDETLDVQVTLGEREVDLAARRWVPQDDYLPALGGLQPWRDDFVRAEIVLKTDDGFKTIRVVTGTVGEVDVQAGTFVLAPADGTTPVAYEVTEDTRVLIGHYGDISGLNEEDKTLVVEEDGQVTFVVQGDFPPERIPSSAPFSGFGFGQDSFPPFEGIPGLQERIDRLLPNLSDGSRWPDCESWNIPDDLPFKLHLSICQSSGEDDLDEGVGETTQ